MQALSLQAPHRLFFALWPDEALRLEITRSALAYPEVRHARRVPAAMVRAAPFSLCLDQVGFWPRPRIFWLGASAPGTVLPELVCNLNQALRAWVVVSE